MKKLVHRTFLALVVATAIVCAVPLASAAESGTFKLQGSYQHNYTVLDFAGSKITSGSIAGTSTIIMSRGGPFTKGEHYNAACAVYSKRSATEFDLEAPCILSSKAGDKIYLMAKRRSGNLKTGGGGKGTHKIMGGTGKYAGMTGTCSYTTAYLPDRWLVVSSDCKWSKP